MSDTELALRPAQGLTKFRLIPSTLGEAMEMATLIAKSELCPKSYRGKAADCLIAYEYGAALGLSWLQSLRSISVINGQGALWGDAVPALILAGGDCERFHETFSGEPYKDDSMAVCTMKRKGLPDETVRTFSVADAKAANLWGKQGPWTQYTKRMLQMRARGFAARDTFPDKLSGLIIAEEAMDYPDAIEGTVVASEVIVDPMERIPEGVRENVGKAFEMLNLSAAQRLQRINEFLGKEGVTAADGTQALLNWCRDEFSRRKTGQPRKDTNDKPKATPPSPRPSAAPASAPQGESVSDGGAPAPAPTPVSVEEVNFRSGPPSVPPLGEMF